MLELPNALMEVLQQLGALEIAALLAAVILLLIWLMVRVIRRNSVPAVAVDQGNVFSESAAAPTPKVIVNPAVVASVAENTAVARSVSSAALSGMPPMFPQDSVLKRHFITQLQAEIEAHVAPRPSDSVLLRHYQTLLAAELDKRLSAFNG